MGKKRHAKDTNLTEHFLSSEGVNLTNQRRQRLKDKVQITIDSTTPTLCLPDASMQQGRAGGSPI